MGMSERDQFESWSRSDVDLRITLESEVYAGIAWMAWQASREALKAEQTTEAIPSQGSNEVNDAAWKLHDMLTEYGPLNGYQFNNLKGCFYEALKVAMSLPSHHPIDTTSNQYDALGKGGEQ